jgi:hypothetical protein
VDTALPRSDRELWWAFFASLAITLVYLFVTVTWRAVPAASSLFGQAIGIVGFILMIMTESLYSLRKRSRNARWGRMSTWMQFHIFTGLVGPYMVLLHTSWKFHGLAGVVMLLTVVIVASGFAGRYIYTAIPRTADGVEIELGELVRQIAAIDDALSLWNVAQPQAPSALRFRLALNPSAGSTDLTLGLGSAVSDWIERWRWKVQERHLDPVIRDQARKLERLAKRRQTLRRQVASLAAARQMLSLWHVVHVPIGIALFTAASIHAVAAIYFTILAR